MSSVVPLLPVSPLLAVELVVEAAGVADGSPAGVPPPETGLVGPTVRTAGPRHLSRLWSRGRDRDRDRDRKRQRGRYWSLTLEVVWGMVVWLGVCLVEAGVLAGQLVQGHHSSTLLRQPVPHLRHPHLGPLRLDGEVLLVEGGDGSIYPRVRVRHVRRVVPLHHLSDLLDELSRTDERQFLARCYIGDLLIGYHWQ